MALSGNASRALEQVKTGLYMLYGADYFTEYEWIKIDGLIHKGKYVFTQGPPNSNLLEEELMSFEDSNDTPQPRLNLQTEPMETFEFTETDIVNVSETEVSPTSELSGSSESNEDGTNPTSPENSPDEEAAPQQQANKEGTLFDFSEQTAPETTSAPAPAWTQVDTEPISKPIERPKPANGGLSLGYTQAQLDEVKAFNAGLTKAGQKSRPKYNKSNQTVSSPPRSESQNWSEDEAYQPQETPTIAESHPSPTIEAREIHIQSWANKVEGQGPNLNSADPTSWTSPKTQDLNENGSSPLTLTAEDLKAALVAKFVEAHGRVPKSVNDIYQPHNPEFRPLEARKKSISTSTPKRPESRVSAKTSQSSRTLPKSLSKPSTVSQTQPSQAPRGPMLAGKLGVASNTILVAQSSVLKAKRPCIQILAGDKVRVLKHVSGMSYYGSNLRTKENGQFPATLFKKAPVTGGEAEKLVLLQQKMAIQNSQGHKRAESEYSNGIDRVENMNAAEWDDVPFVAPRRPRTVAPTPVRPIKGLGASRYATLAENAEEKVRGDGKEDQEFVHGITKEEVRQIFDEKVEQILRAQNRNSNARTSPHPPKTYVRTNVLGKDPLKPVKPKTEICWFWSTPNKECRFTAEECRDLHSYPANYNPAGSNLRMGKPTWGAFADSLPSPSPTSITPSSKWYSNDSIKWGEGGNGGIAMPNGMAKKLTCFFWANDGNCAYTAENCKYLHERGGNAIGVASRPKGYVDADVKKDLSTWDRFGKESKDGWGDSVVQGGEWGGGLDYGDDDEGTVGAGEGEGEFILEEVKEEEIRNQSDAGGVSGWENPESGNTMENGWGWGQPIDPKSEAYASAW